MMLEMKSGIGTGSCAVAVMIACSRPSVDRAVRQAPGEREKMRGSGKGGPSSLLLSRLDSLAFFHSPPIESLEQATVISMVIY